MPPSDRPLRATIGRGLQSAGIDWEVAVEATGWPLMMHLVTVGLGLAIVNDFCRLPPGTTARPVADLPPLHYYVLRRAGARHGHEVDRLETTLLRSVSRTKPGAAPA